MLYLVGGCSRSGKSSLAERMRVRHGAAFFDTGAHFDGGLKAAERCLIGD
jgi:adenosyl cobinamide kinase/adenosyl cobinamide phosphate guanylyltransferase